MRDLEPASCNAEAFASHASARSLSSAANYQHPDDIVGEISPITRSLWFERQRLNQHSLEDSRLPEPVVKPPHLTSVTYGFATDAGLREQYRNPWGNVRIGRLLEDLDAMAGNIAGSHSDDGVPETRPHLLVTASVDRITLARRLMLDADLQMSGCVVWTGRSALDIRMELRQEGCSDPSLEALFTFVARDPVTRKSMIVNPLDPQTAAQAALFAERQRLAEARKAARQSGGSVDQPGEAARQQWTGLLAEGRAALDLKTLAPSDAVLMRDTSMQNTFICQPQQRNMAGRIFGGFLMRRAYELAFATCYMFAGVRPVFQEVDEVTFQNPVSIGDLLRFTSHVIYTARHSGDPTLGRIHVEVISAVIEPEAASSTVCNRFNFVFEITTARRCTDGGAAPLKRVLPANDEEAARMLKYVGL